jgi:hypothetical protein
VPRDGGPPRRRRVRKVRRCGRTLTVRGGTQRGVGLAGKAGLPFAFEAALAMIPGGRGTRARARTHAQAYERTHTRTQSNHVHGAHGARARTTHGTHCGRSR